MQFWNEIINTALLGTDKKPLPVATLPTPLQEAAATINEHVPTDKEDQFLQLAAISFNFRQSGSKPLHQPNISLAEAEPESFPYCSPRAIQVLKDILAEDNTSLLTYWLDRCVAAQQLITPDLIPTLFNRSVNHKQLQQAVTTISGRRGEWLSRLNPAWVFKTADGNEEELWHTGTPDQRKTILARTRQLDPAKTREWLTNTWPQENANTKADLLRQLDGTVQSEDEPWLITLLTEKSQKVKEEAFRLLRQLPGSALVKNYEQLLQPLLFLKKEKTLLGLGSKTTLSIQLPIVPDKGEYAPGIEKLSSDKFFSDGEFVLYQLMQNVPPSFWEGYFGLPPDGVLDYFSAANEKYVTAFMKAAIQFKDAKWAQTYLNHRHSFYADLLQLLPPNQQEAWCLAHFSQYGDMIAQYASQWSHEWSLPLAKNIIAHTAKQPYQYNISFYKSNIARIPAAIAGQLESYGPAEPAYRPLWITMIEQIRRLLALKEQTQNAFNV